VVGGKPRHFGSGHLRVGQGGTLRGYLREEVLNGAEGADRNSRACSGPCSGACSSNTAADTTMFVQSMEARRRACSARARNLVRKGPEIW